MGALRPKDVPYRGARRGNKPYDADREPEVYSEQGLPEKLKRSGRHVVFPHQICLVLRKSYLTQNFSFVQKIPNDVSHFQPPGGGGEGRLPVGPPFCPGTLLSTHVVIPHLSGTQPSTGHMVLKKKGEGFPFIAPFQCNHLQTQQPTGKE